MRLTLSLADPTVSQLATREPPRAPRRPDTRGPYMAMAGCCGSGGGGHKCEGSTGRPAIAGLLVDLTSGEGHKPERRGTSERNTA